MANKIEQDKETIDFMVRLYCKHHLKTREVPQEYLDLIDYACKRLERCRFGERKPACKDCPIHCYKPELREKTKEIMRWVGPRMIFYAPKATFRHIKQHILSRVNNSNKKS